MSATRSWEDYLTDGNGAQIRVRVEIDEGIIGKVTVPRLTNKARRHPKRVAQALDGAVRVTILSDSKVHP